jgi:hypothetical protein
LPYSCSIVEQPVDSVRGANLLYASRVCILPEGCWDGPVTGVGVAAAYAMAQHDTAHGQGDTRICGKAGSRHSPSLPDPNCPLWRERFNLFPDFFDHMLVTEDERRFPCGMVTLWQMSGNLGDKVEAEKRKRNLGIDLPVTVFISNVRGDLLEMLFKLFYTGEVCSVDGICC